jgi:hypothetical protein
MGLTTRIYPKNMNNSKQKYCMFSENLEMEGGSWPQLAITKLHQCIYEKGSIGLFLKKNYR